MEALTSPLLKTRAHHDVDIPINGAELGAIAELARRRRARSVVIGSGRTSHAIEGVQAIAAALQASGTQAPDTVTWPEAGASWLRQATRFADADPDLWVMVGPATGWAQMTRRLLWSTRWMPSRTLTTAGIGDPRTLALVGLINLDGLAGAAADGSMWFVSSDAVTRFGTAEEGR
jgi:hypothetical protein